MTMGSVPHPENGLATSWVAAPRERNRKR